MSIRNALRSALAGGLLLSFAAGCSQPPRGASSDPDRPLPPPPSDESEAPDSVYDFEKEGDFPAPSRDVEFEEDALPPRPEEVQGGTLTVDPIVTDDSSMEDDLGLPEAAGEDRGPEVERLLPSQTTPVEPSVNAPQEGATVRMVRGFRVQIAASGERVEAQRVAREAQQRLSVAVHVDFESPYYKVRAGDFVDRAGALALRDRARSNGYDGAWVVATQVESRNRGNGAVGGS